MDIEVSADINKYPWMISFLLKKKFIEKKIVFLKDKTLTHNIHKFCSLFLSIVRS
jgi:hypothetical protein